jgi:hypothetical protein
MGVEHTTYLAPRNDGKMNQCFRGRLASAPDYLTISCDPEKIIGAEHSLVRATLGDQNLQRPAMEYYAEIPTRPQYPPPLIELPSQDDQIGGCLIFRANLAMRSHEFHLVP